MKRNCCKIVSTLVLTGVSSDVHHIFLCKLIHPDRTLDVSSCEFFKGWSDGNNCCIFREGTPPSTGYCGCPAAHEDALMIDKLEEL